MLAFLCLYKFVCFGKIDQLDIAKLLTNDDSYENVCMKPKHCLKMIERKKKSREKSD